MVMTCEQVDLLLEDIAGFPDAQVGQAVRLQLSSDPANTLKAEVVELEDAPKMPGPPLGAHDLPAGDLGQQLRHSAVVERPPGRLPIRERA